MIFPGFSKKFQVYLPPAYVVRQEGTVFTGVCLLTFRGGVPGLRFSGRLIQPWMGGRGGSQVSDFRVGSSSLGWGGGGGGPSLSKGENFLTPDLA